ncbi:hypothetical protein ABW19_dt0203455 [Dactylella cylindrospora]|nr:hypothetical protein ABW19_dt0203455 [Dactylella cylindrospora]
MGTVTHIAAMERANSRKLRQNRRAKGKRTSRVIVQGGISTGRPVSIAKSPLKTKFSAGNIMRTRKRSGKNKRRSIPPPHQPVRRHIGRTHSDCSSCFCDDDKRDSLVIAARHVSPKQPTVTPAAPAGSSPSSPHLRSIDIGAAMARSEKTDSIAIFTSPIIEEFSLQPKKKARPPSSAAATKTSSIYYETTPPPVPKRTSEEETGFHAQYRLLDERTVRSVVNKAVALKKADEKKMEALVAKSARSSHRSEKSSRSSTAAPKRSSSMGHASKSPTPSGLRRSGTTANSLHSKGASPSVTIESCYKDKHSSTGSRTGTVNSGGSRSSSAMGFRRQSTPFDNKPLPKLPDDASINGSVDLGRPSVSPTGGMVMPPIATFEDLMSQTTSSINESAEINSVKQVTMVAGHPELR